MSTTQNDESSINKSIWLNVPLPILSPCLSETVNDGRPQKQCIMYVVFSQSEMRFRRIKIRSVPNRALLTYVDTWVLARAVSSPNHRSSCGLPRRRIETGLVLLCLWKACILSAETILRSPSPLLVFNLICSISQGSLYILFLLLVIAGGGRD